MIIFTVMPAMLDNEVFLDSAYVIALAYSTDAHHRQAAEFAGVVSLRKTILVTTRAIILEIGNALAKAQVRAAAIKLIGEFQSSQFVRVVPLTEELAGRGWTLFCQRHDKDWSLTDCISFVVMQERRIRQALTSDGHFEQAGFTALLRD